MEKSVIIPNLKACRIKKIDVPQILFHNCQRGAILNWNVLYI